MKVKGTVKLLCDACVRIKVMVSRTKAQYFVKCSKNGRHNQRQKCPGIHTSAECQEGVAHTCGHEGASIPILSEVVSTHQAHAGMPHSALLASRGGSVGQMMWQAQGRGQ
mmetsp:Transcript_11091/g.19301  ORF Transcript_11091/g.19301 Transcript_11091/m.19301 type:complete len:110 (-) Transcript_11091:534-863(-)